MRPIADAFKAIERQWNQRIQQEFQDDSSNSDSDENDVIMKTFREEFDLDEDTAKITVPTFRDGRAGRFVHDFKLNQTGIIDLTAKRCFVMPLDRSHVVPPKNMRDLIVKVSFFEAKYSFLKLREYSKN
jgi:integral membrane protein 2B